MNFTVSERITLTKTRPEDQGDVFAHLQEREVGRYMPWMPWPYTQEHAAKWLAHVSAPGYDRPQTRWAIRDETQRMIGVVELAPQEGPLDHMAEIGYWLAKPYWGQGIMTAVVKTMVGHAFQQEKIVRLFAPIFAANLGSARVLEKAGFSAEAPLMRKRYFRDGRYHDGTQYALVREEPEDHMAQRYRKPALLVRGERGDARGLRPFSIVGLSYPGNRSCLARPWAEVRKPVGFRSQYHVFTFFDSTSSNSFTPLVMRFSLFKGYFLSPLVPEDRQAAFVHLQEREIYERTLMIPWPYTLADADEFIAFTVQETAKRGYPLHWAIRTSCGTLIGGIGLTLHGRGREHSAEIGYWLAKPFWGQGIVTSAVKAVVEHAFNNLLLERIVATVFCGNHASGRVLEKAGFQLEGGLLRHAYRKDGRYLNGRLYARVRSFYPNKNFCGSKAGVTSDRLCVP